jgi:anti-sigma factor RsiW
MKSVSCSDVDHNLWRYIDRELSAGDLSAISAHLRGCEPCRAQYHEWAREASQYRRVLVEAPFGEGFVSRLRHRMRDEGLFATSRRSPFEAFSFHRRRVRRIATVAAMLILIPIVVVVGFLSNLPGPLQLGSFESEGGPVGFLPAGASEQKAMRQMKSGVYAAGAAFVVPRGAVATLHLGSPSLNDDSILKLTGPARFVIDPEATKAVFRARLSSGVLRADVARRALAEPFAITTENARVMVLGTEFELSALEARTVLRVWNGIVAFQGIDALPGKAPVDVTREKGPYVVEKGAMQPVPLQEPDVRADATPPPEKTHPRPEAVHGNGSAAVAPPVEETTTQPPRPVPAPEPATKEPAKPVSPGPDLDTPVER